MLQPEPRHVERTITFSVLIGYIILAGCMTILLPVLMLRLLLAYIELVNKIIYSSPFFVVGSLFVDTIDMISTEINEGGRLIAVTAVGWGRLTCQGASSLILTVAQLLWSLALFCLHHPLIGISHSHSHSFQPIKHWH